MPVTVPTAPPPPAHVDDCAAGLSAVGQRLA